MSAKGAASPRVSVALCTYNSGAYIEAQLRSILDQTRPVDEVVVGDDGSTDGTVEKVSAIAAAHSRGSIVRVAFTTSAGGVVQNFSRTLAACEGDVIALSDHDDVWHRDKTSVLVPALAAAGPRALVFTDARLIDGTGVATGRTLFGAYSVSEEEREAIRRGEGLTALVRRNIVTGATAAFSRDLLDAALPIPPLFIHDEWLALVAASAGSLLIEDRALIDYRVHGANQIGVPPATLWGQARVAWRGRRQRYIDLRARTLALRERLERLGVDDASLALLDAKATFEEARASSPRLQPARLPGILRRYRSGDYARFTHRPSLERWRDLIQRG